MALAGERIAAPVDDASDVCINCSSGRCGDRAAEAAKGPFPASLRGFRALLTSGVCEYESTHRRLFTEAERCLIFWGPLPKHCGGFGGCCFF